MLKRRISYAGHSTMLWYWRLTPLLALALVAAGCAQHRVSTTADAPSPDPAGGASVDSLRVPALDSYIERMRELSWKSRPKAVKTDIATVESRNRELMVALAAVAVAPSSQAHVAVGEAYKSARILDKAHEHLTQAVRMDRRNARAYDGMARIWRDWGFPNLGLPDGHRAVFYAPASPEAHNTLGTLLQALGNIPAARAEYERALALNPRAAYALNNLCNLDMIAGDPLAAARRCEQAVQIDPALMVASRNLELARATLRAFALEAPDGRF